MTTERDPRKDPKAGDVFRSPKCTRRIAQPHESDSIDCVYFWQEMHPTRGMFLRAQDRAVFLDWAANAEVIHAAE